MSIVRKIREICPDGFDAYEFVNEVLCWPLIPGDDNTLEWVDVENFFIKELEDDYMVVICGGDWQEAHVIRIELVDNNLTVTEKRLATDEDYATEEIEVE